MTRYTKPSKQTLTSYYSDGKSMSEIAQILHCSINTIVYWMTKYKIKRRNHSDATYLKENPNGDPFHIKEHLDLNDQLLLGIGIGIYLGEGNKVTKHAIRVTNTNPLILKLFLRFLHTICSFDKNRISASIVCFNDADPEKSRAHWSKELQISPSKFGKITLIGSQGKGIYKRKSEFGVCTVQANNIKLTSWLRSQIAQLEPS